MTISSTTNRNDYTGNGATATYSYGFKIFSKTDLLVTTRNALNVETTLTVDTDYTVAGVGDTAGGSITLVAGNLTSGYHLTIRRVRPLTQGTDIRNQGDFYSEIHEDTFDHLVMLIQQVQSVLDRAFKLSETTTGISGTLPAPEALKWPRWNATATALENMSIADITIATIIGAGLKLTGQTLSTDNALLAANSPSMAQIQNHVNCYGADTGAANAYVVAFTPAITALTAGMELSFLAANANTTASTVNVGTGVVAIKRLDGTALQANDILAGGIYKIKHNGTVWQLPQALLVAPPTTGQACFFALGDTALSGTQYMMLGGPTPAGGGGGSPNTTESLMQVVAPFAGSLKNMYVNVVSNSRNGNTTFTVRKNGSSMTCTITVGASATGLFSDTTHSDTFVAGDLLNIISVVGGSSGAFTSFSGSIMMVPN